MLPCLALMIKVKEFNDDYSECMKTNKRTLTDTHEKQSTLIKSSAETKKRRTVIKI